MGDCVEEAVLACSAGFAAVCTMAGAVEGVSTDSVGLVEAESDDSGSSCRASSRFGAGAAASVKGIIDSLGLNMDEGARSWLYTFEIIFAASVVIAGAMYFSGSTICVKFAAAVFASLVS